MILAMTTSKEKLGMKYRYWTQLLGPLTTAIRETLTGPKIMKNARNDAILASENKFCRTMHMQRFPIPRSQVET